MIKLNKNKVEIEKIENFHPVVQTYIKDYFHTLNKCFNENEIPFENKNVFVNIKNEIEFNKMYIEELEKMCAELLQKDEYEFIKKYSEEAFENLAFGQYKGQNWIRLSDIRHKFIDLTTPGIKNGLDTEKTPYKMIQFPVGLQENILRYFLTEYNIHIKTEDNEIWIENMMKGLPDPNSLDEEILKQADEVNNYIHL